MRYSFSDLLFSPYAWVYWPFLLFGDALIVFWDSGILGAVIVMFSALRLGMNAEWSRRERVGENMNSSL